MPHDSSERRYTPEELARWACHFARTVDHWPEGATFDRNVHCWLLEVLSREARYFDAKYDQTGGLLPSESLARAEIYFSPIFSATDERTAELLTALDALIVAQRMWGTRATAALERHRASATLEERKRRKWKSGLRRRKMLMKRYAYCVALLENFQHSALRSSTRRLAASASAPFSPNDGSSSTLSHPAAGTAQEDSHG